MESQLNRFKNEENKKVSFSLQEGIVFLNTKDIIRCEAHGNYTKIFSTNHDTILISQTLKNVESKIDDSEFLRVHSGHLVNKSYIKQLTKTDGAKAILSNNDEVPVSRSKWKLVVGAM